MNKTSKLALAIAGALTVPASVTFAAGERLEEVNVTVSPLEKPVDAVAAPVSVLSGEALREAASATLGDTLKGELGVANASFGSGVGLPVIRGQSANRVKILSDNMDTADASNTSADHAVAIEPLLAQRIEILRGPATLRYGSGAIGGVVNVIDGRIPTSIPEQTEGALEMRHNSGNDQDAGVFRLNGGAGQLAWYVDGVYRENDDTRIPGLAILEHEGEHGEEHAGEELAGEEHGHEEEFNTDGFVGNTSARAHSYSGGVSWIGEQGYVGLSVNRLENNYGIPLGTHEHHHEEEHAGEELAGEEHGGEHGEEGEESVRIDLAQTRYDMKGERRLNDEYWDKLSFRLGYNDYEHVELEEGEPGTRFTNEAWESRVELTHDAGGEWRGAYGLQLSDKDFAAVGDEAFIQPSNTRAAGLFAMKERAWGDWHLDMGGRVERVEVDPEFADSRDFNLLGLSSSLQYFLAEHQHVSLGLTGAERAPVAEELFAEGAHLAEARFIEGDADLDKEQSFNLELGYHHHNEEASGWHAARFEANLFYNHVADYIYAANTGEENLEEELPIYAYNNRDTVFYGAEASLRFPFAGGHYVELFGDSVRASFTSDLALHHEEHEEAEHEHAHEEGEGREYSTDVPRMPPLRVGLAFGGDYAQWNWELRTTKASEQERAGAFEEATDGYTRMDLTARYNVKVGTSDAVLFASARNLLDEEIRNSTSLLRDFAPEMGRSVEAGVRFLF
ncbi:TonB-dependent receptor [Microbulbifer flavimaris]|uniref:TonB-dependent receptor n=1 Tax=Microbulbifer flavimaris TaxID=1781068 RepID=A0ABX4I0X9_9GAMM|nr:MULTISPECIES: TonB-dependent receptor [Microbulbifer]KUJ83796.1 TonB-dependent receptor [Microbulbifer sp. ZGT114]PCO05971.1 TonB-dependent receptor [Microbulbifer flavimaris]